MDKYTPGPWKLTGWTAPDSYGWNIECDQRFQLHAESAESEANAYLIAAAPELLEALGDALEEMENDTCVECGQQWDECECPNGDWWRKARGAIAKAKGETK